MADRDTLAFGADAITQLCHAHWAERENELVAGLMKNTVIRVCEAVEEERRKAVAFARRNPGMSGVMVAAFLEEGEHLK